MIKPFFQTELGKLYQGNVLDIPEVVKAGSVQCCVTSPPYWGLRDYGLPPQIWDSTPPDICEGGRDHVWGDEQRPANYNYEDKIKAVGNLDHGHQKAVSKTSSQFCQNCNAWRGSLGLEPTPELFIQHMVEVFRGVWKVLRDDGCLWLNMGDSYGTGTTAPRQSGKRGIGDNTQNAQDAVPRAGGMAKQLLGIPWRLALALQQDGWFLRSAMPWVKRSAMPESVQDRPASALEYVFLFSKQQRYFFDMDSIRVPHKDESILRANRNSYPNKERGEAFPGNHPSARDRGEGTVPIGEGGRNFRNTDLYYQSITPPHGAIFAGDEMVGLDVNPQGFKEAHFATFPEKLVLPLIMAGTSEKGCCPECGTPWERVVEKTITNRATGGTGANQDRHDGGKACNADRQSKTIGWKPGCSHYPDVDGWNI